jgi:HEAT repeat protein
MTKPSARQGEDAPAREYTPEELVAIKAATSWINLLSRTLKTCRLYDGANPTVARFRDELGASIGHLTEQHGALTYKITADDLRFDDVSMYPAKSRDDSLALPLFRDGIHAITFHPGVERRETDALVDALLKVSGQNEDDDDLVTLLWEAHLNHIEMDYIPAEGDLGVNMGGEGAASPVPWPGGGNGTEAGADESSEDEGEGHQAGRSDDWSIGDLTAEVEASFIDLEKSMSNATQEFCAQYEAEHAGSLVESAVAIAEACLAVPLQPSDRDELARFVPRALRQSVTDGEWKLAGETLAVLNRCGSKEWSAETFSQELMQPVSITAMVGKLDQQDTRQVQEFLAFAGVLGDPTIDLINLVLGESKVRRTRRLLAEAITERLAPGLADPRWYVVRNIIHILGWIGGPQIIGLLQTASRHPEPKVRMEVVAALSQLELKVARPLLIKMLENADSRLFSLILHQLASRRDGATARLLIGYLQDPKFDQRPIEEKRAIYSALSGAGGDEVLPDLEAELLRGNWFTGPQEDHRHAIARCIARIGTPAAKAMLERGARSKRGAVRKACEEAMTHGHATEEQPPAAPPTGEAAEAAEAAGTAEAAETAEPAEAAEAGETPEEGGEIGEAEEEHDV